MKILKGDAGNVDLSGPIKLTDDQKKRFINYFQERCQVIEVEETKKFREKRTGEKFFTREWAIEEDVILHNLTLTPKQMMEKLRRSEMSVDMRRSEVIGPILVFANEIGLEICEENIEEIVIAFRKKKIDEKEERKRARQEERNKIKQIDIDIKSLESLKNRLKELSFLKRSIPEQYSEEEVEKVIKEIKRIQNLR